MPGPAKKSFPLRVNAELMDALQRWADDDLRSVNGQIEFVLREALRRAGRLKTAAPAPAAIPEDAPETSDAADEGSDDQPFLVTRPSSGEDDEEIFPVRRPPE